jgi:hypothetical protein
MRCAGIGLGPELWSGQANADSVVSENGTELVGRAILSFTQDTGISHTTEPGVRTGSKTGQGVPGLMFARARLEPSDADYDGAANLLGSGAACVTRTRDPIITNDVLYRLS